MYVKRSKKSCTIRTKTTCNRSSNSLKCNKTCTSYSLQFQLNGANKSRSRLLWRFRGQHSRNFFYQTKSRSTCLFFNKIRCTTSSRTQTFGNKTTKMFVSLLSCTMWYIIHIFWSSSYTTTKQLRGFKGNTSQRVNFYVPRFRLPLRFPSFAIPNFRQRSEASCWSTNTILCKGSSPPSYFHTTSMVQGNTMYLWHKQFLGC